MTRMTGPDCVVMCNLINTHTHTHTHSIDSINSINCAASVIGYYYWIVPRKPVDVSNAASSVRLHDVSFVFDEGIASGLLRGTQRALFSFASKYRRPMSYGL